MSPRTTRLSLALACVLGLVAIASAQRGAERRAPERTKLEEAWVESFDFRSIGPANMGGRIIDISVYEADPSIFYVATASGGLLKTTNNGVTFEHQFDRETTVSLGAVCVAPSNPDVVWVGTGEYSPRNSVSYGDGVYKSTDGGKTWKNMGLKDSFQIGRIVIHPTDPDIVYVGTLGRLWGPNEERGLYKTTDGGKKWNKIHYVDEKTGVIEIKMHPEDPDTLIFATYERMRDGFDGNDPAVKIAPGSGLYRTTDGGKTIEKLTEGLPTCNLGRIGVDYYRENPDIVYAIVESEMIGKPGERVGWAGFQAEDAEAGARVTAVSEGGPAEKAGLKQGDIILAVGGETVLSNRQLLEAITRYEIDAKVSVMFAREGESRTVEMTLVKQPERGARGGRGEQGERGQARGERREGGGEESESGEEEGQRGQEGERSQEGQRGQEGERSQARERAPEERGRQFGGGGAGPGGFGGRGRRGGGGLNFSANLGGQAANVHKLQGKEGFQHGGVYRSDDGGTTWRRINSINPRPMYFSQVRVDPNDNQHLYVLGVQLDRSKDGGETFTSDGGRGVHADHHAMWIDPKDGRHIMLGCDGGLYVTYDRAESWDHLNHMAMGQFYHVAVGPRRDYWVYGGLQDNGSWGGPHRSSNHSGTTNEDWIRIGGGDGFVCRVDPNDWAQIYYESQNGATGRTHLETLESGRIRPQPIEGTRYRFNWNTPFILSSHNSRIYYSAGNYVFRSLDRGNDIEAISPEITRTDRGSATAIAESPRNPNVLYVGTDDGALWGTRRGTHEWVDLFGTPEESIATAEEGEGVQVAKSDGGADEENGGNGETKEAKPIQRISKNAIAPLRELVPGPRWVSSIEASRFAEGRAYLTLDGHRSDDDEPYVLVTEDFGKNWKSLRSNLPRGSTRVVREDLANENLLYLGTEFGFWVSIDRGQSWTRFHNDLPTVAVHEIAQHAAAGEIVLATHGRSLWVLDVTALRQLTSETLDAAAHLYRPNDVIVWRTRHRRGVSGARHFAGENPSNRAEIFYSLGRNGGEVSLSVQDPSGKKIRTLEAESRSGLHRVVWDLRPDPPAGASAEGPGGGRFGGGQGGRRFGRGGRSIAPGKYEVVLEVRGEVFKQPLMIQGDPNFPSSTELVLEEELYFEEEEEDIDR